MVNESDIQPNHTLERVVKRLRRASPQLDDELFGETGMADESKLGSEAYRSFLHDLRREKQVQLDNIQRVMNAIQSELDTDDYCQSSVPGSPIHQSATAHAKRTVELGSLFEKRVLKGQNDHFSIVFDKLTLHYTMHIVNSTTFGDILSGSNVVSSVEYNHTNGLFAVSGSCKQIRIYDYDSFSRPLPVFGGSTIQSAVGQFGTTCKVASLSWSPSDNAHLASADYEGSVKLYDIHSGTVIMSFDEHERRVWSIDFSRADPETIISGSDDGRIKIWSTSCSQSTCTVDVKANVCSVQFHPDGLQFACGAADHNVYIHDLRYPSKSIYSLEEHRKAVSYVKWLDRSTLLSASTDNTIMQWHGQTRTLTHRGHVHEKNFVGMATLAGEWFACGSEANKVHVYSRHLEAPISELFLGGRDPLSGELLDMEGFVSSVSWVSESELLVGNSLGLCCAVCIKSE